METMHPEEVGESTATEVITRVAAWKDVDPVDLEPLSDTVNPDSLDALFAGTSRSGQISFRYGGCEVVIEGNDQVIVQALQEDSGSVADVAASQEG